MDTTLGSHGSKWREVDWAAAAVSGFAAGAVLMVLDLIWSAIFNPDGPWRTSHMIAPIFTGNLRTSGFEFDLTVIAISLVTHYALGVIFGLAIAAILVQLKLESSVVLATIGGVTLGLALYLINFELLTVFFPWLAALRGADTVAAHMVFGAVAALLYRRLKRTLLESV
jgi:hypothetical protein